MSSDSHRELHCRCRRCCPPLELPAAGHVFLDDPLVQQSHQPQRTLDRLLPMRLHRRHALSLDATCGDDTSRLTTRLRRSARCQYPMRRLLKTSCSCCTTFPQRRRRACGRSTTTRPRDSIPRACVWRRRASACRSSRSPWRTDGRASLADVGGFVNLLSLIMLALFPVTMTAVKQRDFFPNWIVAKWRHRGRSGADKADDADAGINAAATAASHAPVVADGCAREHSHRSCGICRLPTCGCTTAHWCGVCLFVVLCRSALAIPIVLPSLTPCSAPFLLPLAPPPFSGSSPQSVCLAMTEPREPKSTKRRQDSDAAAAAGSVSGTVELEDRAVRQRIGSAGVSSASVVAPAVAAQASAAGQLSSASGSRSRGAIR